MSQTKRATVYIDQDLHRALRMKAAETEQSISKLVNEALRQSLMEDADDFIAFETRAREPDLDFAAVLKDLRQRGKL